MKIKALSLLFLSILMFTSTILMPFTQVSADQVTNPNNQTEEVKETNQENTIEPYRNSCGINGCNENPAVDACVGRAVVDNWFASLTGATAEAILVHIKNRNLVSAAQSLVSQVRGLNYATALGQIVYFQGRCSLNTNYA